MAYEDFSRKCEELGEHAKSPPIHEPNEAQTRAMLVDPFLRALGNETNDLAIVVPEYQVRFRDANPEAVDYAIQDIKREPMILMETKSLNTRLDGNHARQLSRYFNATTARVGVLTNGAIYEVYLDNDTPNMMDEEPFFRFDLSNGDEDARRAFYKLARLVDGSFDRGEFEQAVEEWKITTNVKPRAMRLFQQWYEGSADDLGELLAQQLTLQEARAESRLVSSLAADWFKEFVDGRVPPPIPVPHPDPDPPLASDWKPLPKWRIITTEDMPDEIMFPDQSTAPIHNGYDVPMEIARWLRRKGHLRDEHVPMRTGQNARGKMFLLSFTLDNPMQTPKEVAVEGEEFVWIATGFNAPTQKENAMRIIARVAQSPSEFRGRWRS